MNRHGLGLGLGPLALSTLAALALSAFSPDASALLVDNAALDDATVELTYFYPYPTTYSFVDERYAFDDDPLTAFAHRPYIMPITVHRVQVRRALVMPRVSFVDEMVESADAI